MTEQQELLVAQVLTLAAALELKDKITERVVSTNYKRQAVNLIARESREVLELLAETKRNPR